MTTSGDRRILAAIADLKETLMTQLNDFGQAQSDLDAAIAKVAADVTALLAKVNANPALAAEVTAEVAAVQSSTAALGAIDTSANA